MRLHNFCFFLIIMILSCSKKIKTSFQENVPLIDQITRQIQAGTIKKGALIFVEDLSLDEDQLQVLNKLELADFTDIKYVSKKDAKKRYGEPGKNGAVILTPFKDPLLADQYYEKISDKFPMNWKKNDDFSGHSLVVLDGIPLRGNDIHIELDKIGKEDIEEIHFLKWKPGIEIYGIRALYGVVIIETKQ